MRVEGASMLPIVERLSGGISLARWIIEDRNEEMSNARGYKEWENSGYVEA